MVFIELNMLFYIMISRHRTKPSTYPASITTTAPSIRKKEESTESMGYALDTAERGERLLQNTLGQLITSDIPDYRNFTRMEPAIFNLIEGRITPCLRKSTTNFRKPLEVRLKLAVTLRHLSTGKTYTSL